MFGFGSSTMGFFLGTMGLLFGLPLRLLLGTTGLLFRLALGLLLCTLHFGLLLTTYGFFRLSLRLLLRAALCFLLGTHLLLFSGTACNFLLLTLHGGGLSLLANTFGFRSGGLFAGHAFCRGTLLLGRHLMLLHCGGLGLSARFFSLGGSLLGRHALLCSQDLHAVFFHFGIRSRQLSGPFLCHGALLQFQLLALLHCGGMRLFPGSMHVSFFSFGKCSGGPLLGCHFFCCDWLLCNAGFCRRLRLDCWWGSHHGRFGPFRLTDCHSCGSRRFSDLALMRHVPRV